MSRWPRRPARSAGAIAAATVALLGVGCTRTEDGGRAERTRAASSIESSILGVRSVVASPSSGARPTLACPSYRHELAGLVADGRLIEASGLVASRRHEGVLYSHNDSGDGPRIYALRTDGAVLASYRLAGASAEDWEDVALAACPVGGRDCLYVADIGGNRRARESVEVYRVPEPDPTVQPAAREVTLDGVVRIPLRYPRGAHDAEAFLLDPRTHELYVITKNLAGRSGVYRAKVPAGPAVRPIMLDAVATVAFGVPPLGHNPLVTGGAFSPQGDAFIIKTYSTGFLWTIDRGEPLERALERPPCPLRLSSEPQGEAVTFAGDGRGYFTLSEGLHPPLHRFLPE